jgi:hypothetical protein
MKRTSPIFLLAVAVLATAPAVAAAQQACIDDADCQSKTAPKGKGKGKAGGTPFCLAAACVEVGKDQSLLRVRPSVPLVDPAYLYIDDVLMGEIPFEGIVQAGNHAIRVQAHGMLPVGFQGESRAGMADTIVVELKPDPARLPPPPPPAAQQPAYAPLREEVPAIGRIHGGLYGGGAYGTAGWGSDARRPATTLQGGVTLGAAALREPVWIDIGLGVSSTSIYIVDWAEDFGKFVKLNLGLLVRVLFPVKPDFFYIGAELEPGYGISNKRYGYAQLHLALSLLVTDWLELRINPLGAEYCQELMFKGYLISFHATAGLILRFGTF